MTFELRKGNLLAVARSKGGELVSLKDASGREYIWEGDPAFWGGQNPVLFPIVGSLKEGKVNIGGKEYEMGRHGFARGMEFTAVRRGEDFVILELVENEETLARYPFPFALRVNHQLLEDGFATTLTVENTGNSPMPFCIGAHTAIRLPRRARLEDFELAFDVPEQADSLLLNQAGLIRHDGWKALLDGSGKLALDSNTFAQIDTIIFQGLKSQNVTLRRRGEEKGIRLNFQKFPMVAFWTKPGAPFLCMEPWHGCAAMDNENGHFENKPFCLTLEPGNKKSLTYSFYLEHNF